MRKFSQYLSIAASLIIGGGTLTAAQAASVVSVDCSASSISILFDGAVTTNAVTKVEIGRGASATQKFMLDLLPGAVSTNRLTLTPDSTALTQMKKVSPWKAYIFVSGTSSGSAKCNG